MLVCKLWEKDNGGLVITELIKRLAIAYSTYALNIDSKELIKYTAKIATCNRWVKFVSEIMQGDAENEKILEIDVS